MMQQWKHWLRTNPIWRSYRIGLLLLRTLYIINRERTRVVKAYESGDYDVQPDIDALVHILRDFRQTAVAFGGILIKLGQFLGSRADLLPQAALNELASLQDEVKPEEFSDIKQVLENEWKTSIDEVCAWLETETSGSASLGQVHRAQLLDGRMVAIKVQRPGIEAIVRTDLHTLRFVLRIVAFLAPIANRITNLKILYREFSRTIYEELDYYQEARNANQFAEIFADEIDIIVPDVISTYSTRRVLVLEWMDGIKISQVEELDAAGVAREHVASRLIETYLKQALEVGFFHADPHPGNLLIQPDPDFDRIVYLDFGMMGTITPQMSKGLRETFSGIMINDGSRIVRGLDTLGFLSETADRKALEPILSTLIKHVLDASTLQEKQNGTSVRRLRHGPPSELFGDVEMTLYNLPFRLPAQFAYFGRTAGMLMGLTLSLSPQFDFIATATPYARRFLESNNAQGLSWLLNLFGFESVESFGQTALHESVATVQRLATLPHRFDRILTRIEEGEIHLVVDNDNLVRNGHKQVKGRKGIVHILSQPIPTWIPLALASIWGIAHIIRKR
jgi:predicted unusual protein kinase regulating ubiquinone biosynthesis (AarF/ABC1/UbiB family)